MAEITFRDISLEGCRLGARSSHLKKVYLRALPEICIERPRLITRYHLEKGLFEKKRISILDNFV